jgi:pseudouridine-5'-phosphate glycosidase
MKPVLSEEVARALSAGEAVLALESTIIAHGMPYPRNLELARELEAVARAEGVVPATCAVLNGKMHAGLSESELQWFAQNGPDVPKLSRRDMAYALSQGLSGATTVASTMMVAAHAGIRVFSTGGIGGVHRGAAETMDVSADLQELSRTPVAVISAGAKAILDLGLTLEYLETLGVPVIGYQTNEFPAFYSRSSGHGLEHRLDTPEELAHFLHTQWALDPGGGVLIANPIPQSHAIESDAIEQTISEALDLAQSNGIKGKRLTPFLLSKIEQLTAGKSLDANCALALNNVRLGAQVALAFAREKSNQ